MFFEAALESQHTDGESRHVGGTEAGREWIREKGRGRVHEVRFGRGGEDPIGSLAFLSFIRRMKESTAMAHAANESRR